ncbi:tyrosine-type recombinase/integrase [Pseudorhodoferax sp.]|uniref:tyrosine-type recombinase/integrase n=1 Tax=Pseudorhodoferax sp. TaxID=1993553 RepID=UPI002DD6A4C3|nr:site-specific integrase [Pseudorhodoferax sp.]
MTTNKRTAEQLEAKWIAEVHEETVVKGRRPITVKKAIQSYLDSKRGTAGHESAEVKFRPFKQFHDKQLHEVPGASVTKAMQKCVDEGFAINTVNVSIIYWNALQNYATKVGFTPGVKIKRLKGGSNRIRFLTAEEEKTLIAALNPYGKDMNGKDIYREKRKAQDNYDFSIFLLHTGAREQEIATMELTQIDQSNNTITIRRSKGGTDTTMRMTRDMVEILGRRLAAAELPLTEKQTLHGRTGNGFIFPERALAKHNNGFINKACKRVGLKDVTCHTLRHTYACKMLRNGLSITEVQHLLGHKNLTSTMCYLHVVPSAAAGRAADVLDAEAEVAHEPMED